MKSRWAIGVAAGLAVALGLLVFGRPQDAQGQKDDKALKWEYKVVALYPYPPGTRADATTETPEQRITEQMNKLGADGWEFAGVVSTQSLPRFSIPSVAFKRPKR
jgi:hypothetical protein